MTGTVAVSDPLLCGIPLGDIVAQVAEGVPATDPGHQAGCDYCSLALDRTRRWWAAVQETAAEPLTVPPGVQDRVRRWFRRLSTTEWVEILQVEPGRTIVSTTALAGLAGAAAGTVGEVDQVRRAAASLAGSLVNLEVDIVAHFGAELAPLAARVRQAVMADVAALAAYPVASVDVHIVDVAVPG